MAAPSYVSTIARVAKLLEALLHDVAMGMEPEDGCLTILDGDNKPTVAFTPQGIENLKELLADLKR